LLGGYLRTHPGIIAPPNGTLFSVFFSLKMQNC